MASTRVCHHGARVMAWEADGEGLEFEHGKFLNGPSGDTPPSPRDWTGIRGYGVPSAIHSSATQHHECAGRRP